MKKIFLLMLPFSVVLLAACDKVKNPIVKRATVTGTKFVVNDNSAVSNIKKTLLEDYTGALCINCPDAARTATALLAQYPANLVVIAVHAGDFAKPQGSKYSKDFRTNTGDKWNGSSGFHIVGNPNGMINRKDYASNGLVILQTKWSSVFDLAKSDNFVVKLDLTTKYDTTTGSLSAITKATFLKPYPNNIMFLAVLSEDGLTGYQKDGSIEIPNYDFEHVMRGSLNGDWGEVLNSKSTISANDTVTRAYNNFDLLNGLSYTIDNGTGVPPTIKPIKVNDKNVSVVVFAYDAITREVLQVEKVKIR